MRTFSAILLFAAVSACLADISLKLKENDFSRTNGDGGYHFGFNDGHQARQEERSPEGIVRGAYRYVDANGEVQTVTYTADKHNGFLISGSNIPKPEGLEKPVKMTEATISGEIVEDTIEVKTARAEHLEAHKNALNGGHVFVQQQQVPVPVQFTPEVAAARVEHLNAINQERLRNSVYQPIQYVSQPEFQYVAPAAQYHSDYLPYAAL